MTFKKDGADPVDTKPSVSLNFIGQIWRALGIGIPLRVRERNPGDDYHSKRHQQKPKRRRNMLHVSKRVRRKHRKAV